MKIRVDNLMNKLKTDFKDIDQLKKLSRQSSDFTTIHKDIAGQQVSISYFKTLIDAKLLQSNVICSMQNRTWLSELRRLENIKDWIPIDDIEITDQVEDIQAKLFKGYAMVELDQHDRKCMLVNIGNKGGLRKENNTENEFSVVGPKVGFVEDLDTNIRLLRAQINIPNLIVK